MTNKLWINTDQAKKLLENGEAVSTQYGILYNDIDGVFLFNPPFEVKFKSIDGAVRYIVNTGGFNDVLEVAMIVSTDRNGDDVWSTIWGA